MKQSAWNVAQGHPILFTGGHYVGQQTLRILFRHDASRAKRGPKSIAGTKGFVIYQLAA
jgi:hypothetical protein